FAVFNGKLVFNAIGNNPTDGNVGFEPYMYDPATGTTTLLADVVPGPTSGNAADFTAVGGKISFRADHNKALDGNLGNELPFYNPATGTTSLVADLNAGSASSSIDPANGTSQFTVIGSKLYFAANGNNATTGNVGTELFVHDSATGTTSLVADLNAGTAPSSPSQLTAIGTKLFFGAFGNNPTDGNVGFE